MIDNLTIITLNQPGITDFSKARNQAMAKVATDWVLFIDSDETVSPQLEAEIAIAVKNKRFNYQLKRRDIFLGRELKHGETAAVRLIRLIQPGSGKWQGQVHEVFVSKLPVKTLNQPLLHERRITFGQLFDRLNYYSDLKAKELFDQGVKFSLWELLFLPWLKLLHNYILRLGVLDGVPGLMLATLMSWHSLMVRVKLYGLRQKVK